VTSPEDTPCGLDQAQATLRLARDGPNELPAQGRTTWGSAAWSALCQPMVLLLLACTLLYAFLGSVVDSLLLSSSVAVVAAISVYQELRTQRVLDALRRLASPRSTVIRDGVACRVDSRDLVQGDRLIVQEGDRMACDARLVEAHALRVDESLLTGESEPVDKACGSDEAAVSLHAGTLVVQGDGVAQVSATGTRTALGRISGAMAALPARPSRLHSELQRIVRNVALLALLTCVLCAAVYAWREGSWERGLLVGLTLAMSLVPEEFAVVWSVMLALGAWRLAQSKVLTRQPQAIEALGTATVLCVDKTGTLTTNRMEVVAASDDETQWHRLAPPQAPPATHQALRRVAALASVKDAMEPMDQAVFRWAPEQADVAAALQLQLQLREGVQPGRPFVRQSWRAPDGTVLVALKGAYEAVLACCAASPPRQAKRLERLVAQGQAWAAAGLRVLAVAQRSATGADDAALPQAGFEALGLLAFRDPLRDDVPLALQECRDAGVRVVMITGDAPATAMAIARSAGLVTDQDDDALTGAQLDAMTEIQLEAALARVRVFARVSPDHKLRLVQALQRRGEVVAMTGDGVNDGPALRAADIGVAMGERGTDVAREAASLVLLDDRFGSLVEAVRAGRRIFDNLRKSMSYLFAVHVPIVGLSLLPVLGGPVLLLPIHVVLLELIIDPACSLVFEAEPLARDGMRRPPRSAGATLFGAQAALRALGVGTLSFVAVALGQWLGHMAGFSDEALRLTGLAAIVGGNLLMLQWFRRDGRFASAPNRRFSALLLGVCGIGLLTLLVDPVCALLGLPRGMHPAGVLAILLPPAGWAAWKLWGASETLTER
jgi:Ca2+-transporting ATPase